MSLETRLTALAQSIGGDVKTILAAQGSLAALTTTEKSSLVGAINELVSSISGGGVTILDTAGAGDTTHAWSADKIVSALNQVKSDIVNGAPTAYDTLVEIATQLSGDQTALSGLLAAVGNRVAYDAAQSLTTGQKAQACANIGVGNPEHDFVSDYNTAKA